VHGSIPDPNPSGYDPNGLKNHEQNRIPPPESQIDPQPQEPK